MAVFVPGVFVPGVFVEDVVVGPPQLATITSAAPGAGGSTPVGTETILKIPSLPQRFPDIILALHTVAGLRLFGERMISEEIASDDIGRYSNLVSIASLEFRSVPIGNDLLASLASSEQTAHPVRLRNEGKFWTKLVAREPVLCATTEEYLYYGGPEIFLALRAEVSRIVLTKSMVDLELSEP